MPLNPNTIDRRGLTPKVNFDGTYATEYPNGDKPEGEVPAAITNLAASSGPEQANLSWTPNGSTIKLYRRDDTAAGAFQLVTDQISGSANMYADQGLVGQNDYSYKMVAYNEFGDAPDSNIASVTTGAALGDSYQLAADQYQPSRLPLQWVNPNGDEAARSAFLWSHSQFDYVRRVTVLGGAPPYYFYLDSPVAGVSFTRQAPSWNPYLFLWADLVIDHTQFTSGSKTIPLRCIDQEGTIISLSLTVTVDDSKFVVMQDGVAAGGTGTLADPYEDLVDIFTTDVTDATHAGKIIVGRAGTYIADNFDTSRDSLIINEDKPLGWIPYPGESIEFTCQANIVPGDTGGITRTDYYFGDATYNGADSTTTNARVFACLGNHARIVFDHPRFVNPVLGTSGSDNTSCIYFPGSLNVPDHTHVSIIDGFWSGLPQAANGFSCFDFYSVETAAIVGGSLVDSDTSYGAWLKSRVNHCMLAGFDGYDSSGQDAEKILNPKCSRADLYTPIATNQIIGCRAYRATDGLQGDQILRVGDTNDDWGNVFMDRLTAVGGVGFEGSATSMEGTATIENSVVINEQTDPINTGMVSSGNVTTNRAGADAYISITTGDVLSGYAGYGKVGANYAAPEVS